MIEEFRKRGRPSRDAVLASLDRAVADLEAVGGLPRPAEAEEIWKGIWYEEVHNSTAIEGNTLVLKEVQLLLEEGRAVGDKELREYLEVQGYANGAEWVYAQAVDAGDWRTAGMISLAELRECHRAVVAPVWMQFPPDGLDPKEGPGGFRRHDIAPFASGMRPPSFSDVPALVDDWLAAANAALDAHTPPMFRLAELHASFERIHPFRDGNGRTGRLVLNLLLVRHGYPPVVIYKRDRARYLAALARSDHGDTGPLTEMLARSVRVSIDRFLLPALAGPLRLVPLSALATKQLSQVALAVAAKRGRLRAIIQHGQWYSTRQWVAEYSESRYKRTASDP
jgi:fido (protein-threonine AMPylation protein)